MCGLTENQIRVLELIHKGLSKHEIQKITRLPPSTINDAPKRGLRNIDKAIETIRIAVQMGFISDSQRTKLKEICRKI